jgi:hypothetical protein
MTGKCSDVRRYRDWSKMNLVPARVARFRPWATTARLGSYVAEAGAVGAVLRVSSKPGTLRYPFLYGPNERGNFARQLRSQFMLLDLARERHFYWGF